MREKGREGDETGEREIRGGEGWREGDETGEGGGG